MRFFYTFLFLTLTSIVSVQGQSSNFELGIVGGLSFSNVVGADASNNNSIRLGVHLGGYAQFPIEKRFGFRPELHVISIKGTSSGNFRTFYFDAPLLGTYDLDDRFKLMAGVQPSLLINARVGGRGNISNDIRTVDLALLTGLWYQINKQWGAGFRVSRGVSRIGANGDQRTFNVNYQLSIGYRFL